MNGKSLLAGFLAGWLAIAVHSTSPMAWLERKSLDLRFCAREWLGRTVPVSPDVAVVLVDEKTYGDETMRRVPSSLWLPWYSELTGGLLGAGARTVGVDAVLTHFDDAYYRIAWPKLDNALTPLNDALQRPGAGRVVLGAEAYFNPDRAQVIPPTGDMALVVGYDHVGLLNLTADNDDVKRRQWLPAFPVGQAEVWVDGARATWPLPAIPSFAPLLALPNATDFAASVPVFGGGYAYINYAGANLAAVSPYPTWSMSDVLGMIHRHATDDLHRAFAGKIVLVGSGTKDDLHLTPFNLVSLHDMYGVEIHAHVVNMLLTGRYLVPISAGASMALVLLCCLAVGAVGGRVSVRNGLAAVAALEVVAAVSAVALFDSGHVLEVAPLLCAIPVAGVAVYASRFGFVWRMFGRYVSSTLLQDTALLELGTASHRHVTVLFTDINSFSTTCERHTPDEVIAMLNRYFEAMNAIIAESGGWIKQFVGDEIMVIYGAPDAHPRPEHAAVETALRMVRKLAEMKQAATEDGFFEIKAGIHTGQVIVGNVGSHYRTEFAAVGDDVNLGSRIMGMTKALHATILISGATRDKVGDLPGVEFVDHGLQPVKGRQEKVQVYEVKESG